MGLGCPAWFVEDLAPVDAPHMEAEPLGREALQAKWRANEAELIRLAAMTPLDREFHAKREDELLDEQDEIEFRLGFDSPAQADSRRWSGMA